MYARYLKRLFDIFFAVVAMPLLVFLVVFIVAPMIYYDDKGPIFYNANRLGKDGRIFKMYKFRSMKVNSPDYRNPDGTTFNSNSDPRVTKVGAFLRRTSLDELPQLINIIKGDMSLIGPRPDLPEHIKEYKGNEIRVLEVRPGITGLAQAFYRNSISWKERLIHDVYYVDNLSLKLDAKIFLKTLLTVLKQQNIFIHEMTLDICGEDINEKEI